MRLSQIVLLLLFAPLLISCEDGRQSCGDPAAETTTARAQWFDAIEDATYCAVDADCSIYTEDKPCFYHCGVAVNANEVEPLHELAIDLHTRLERCEGGPCPVPTCAPRSSQTRCDEGRCTFAPHQQGGEG
ncbi:MAG: hypothetical protein ACPHCJ_06275 [Oceanococcaceae bacterium]